MIVVIVVCMASLLMVEGTLGCNLPQQWSGKWFQSKEMDLMSINRTSFLNRGLCLDQKQDKFLFYERFLQLLFFFFLNKILFSSYNFIVCLVFIAKKNATDAS